MKKTVFYWEPFEGRKEYMALRWNKRLMACVYQPYNDTNWYLMQGGHFDFLFRERKFSSFELGKEYVEHTMTLLAKDITRYNKQKVEP